MEFLATFLLSNKKEKKDCRLLQGDIGGERLYPSTNRLTQPLVADCKAMLQAFQEVHLLRYYRETNKAADTSKNRH